MNNQLTYENVKATIESEDGWKLLTTEYQNSNQVLEMICQCGHRADRSFNSFRRGNNRCRVCAGGDRYTIEEVRETIERVRETIESESGWRLLTTEYKNANGVLELLCPEGHRADRSFNSFRHGNNRCKVCAGRDKYTLEEIREILASESGWELVAVPIEVSEE